ncbi:hypothetical protein HBI24_128330 [Parastagonospora nodorum]|nr:hypothetical protein HBH52_052240 [Parastagonospora nodorum]KAH5161297.1 hypothetical protein HBH69_032960 [Parastagonospora nodorum]KAH5364756.1 hypothetical protein HBI48_076090 [Parastagonospora nodorum]KAH5581583.1 hypothetical protein HBI24_128330 [Parastagonospora nodorum]KAH5604079.1 hypothetical protein HBI26_064790 [Parastagonospora nodorum]
MEDTKLREKDYAVQVPQHKKFSFSKSHWASALAVGLTLLTLLSLQTLYTKSHTSNALVIPKCGPTPAEAKAQGCVFNPINFSWLPPDCYDKELFDEMLEEEMKRAGPWKWYLAPNFTQEIPQDWEDLSTHTHVWTEHRYHVLHCLGTWRTLHRSVMEGGLGLVPSFIEYGHTMHCAQFIGKAAVSDEMKPRQETVVMLFNGCSRPGDR